MFRNFFRRSGQYVDVRESDDYVRKKNRIVIFVIIAAICMLAFGGLGGDKNKEKNTKTEHTEQEYSPEDYTAETEKRLKEVLSGVKGAGEVEVMVNFESMNEKVLAKNSKNELAADMDGEKSSNSSGHEENILVYGSGSGEQPFVIKERLPVPSGVLVIATGAGDEKVRLEIYEAVKALYGISGHRIKVAEAVQTEK